MPKLLSAGLRIDRAWVQEKLRIPEPEHEDNLLVMQHAPAGMEGMNPSLTGLRAHPNGEPARGAMANLAEIPGSPVTKNPTAALAAPSNGAVAPPDGAEVADPEAADVTLLETAAAPQWQDWLARIEELVTQTPDLPTLQRQLIDAWGGLDAGELTRIMAAALALAELRGMDAVKSGSDDARQ